MMMRKLGVTSLAVAGIAVLLLAGCSREGADWKSAQAADTAEAYQEFLRQHPSGSNATAAQTRLQQIAEDRDWQQASSADTRDAYEQFVTAHASSKWAQEARIRIENFAQGGSSGVPAAASAAGAAAPPGLATAPESPASGVSPPLAAAPPAGAPAKTESSKGASSKVASSKVATSKVSSAKPAAARHVVATKPVKVASASGHYVQLGAFSSKERAQSQWKQLQAKFGQLASLQPRYLAGKSRSKPVYRLQVALPSSDKARELCSSLKKRSQSCVPVVS
jgi:cell division septation protein DedD